MAAFPGTGKIWMNGSLVDWADAKIHIASHVIHYGSAVFEGARCYDTPRGSACFRLDAHLNRLFDSAKIYRMEPALSYDEVHKAVMDTIKANAFKACYIRPLVYRGYHTLGVNPLPCPVDTAILLWDWGAYLGQDALTNGVDVRVSSWARAAPNTFPTLAKTSANYANRNNVIYTPPASASILPGITRDSVVTLARDHGFTVREEMLPRELLYIADEAFFVGTAVEITPIRTVDKIAVGNGRRGPITEALQQAFFDMINGVAADKHGWLEYVYDVEPREAIGATAKALRT